MKFNKKILEAVNRGILLALDNFEDIEDNSSISSDVINTSNVIKQRINLMKEVVDLGLPSGTLWCKYNLDVNLNLLSNAEDWYGKYYAWGELEGNKTDEDGDIYFGWDNYKFGKTSHELTKYCNILEYGNGFTDNLTELLPEDDAAYQFKKCHNFKFHIPTKELCEELINYTTNYWVNNYDPNKTIHNPEDDKGIQGLNGRIFEGKNRNLLFIPAAGYHGDFVISGVGSDCDLWTSNLKLDEPNKAYNLDFISNNISMCKNTRIFGFSIRPVINL